MKNIIKYFTVLILFLGIATSCETDPETLDLFSYKEKSELYYAELRAYKASDHEVFFGWLGGWTASGPSIANYLRGVPDSVDIISIWGPWNNLTDSQLEDMRYVQTVKGTKVLFTVFAHGIPEPFDATKEGIEAYASALCDSVYKYGYDGLDLDYEPGFGGQGPLVSGAGHYDNMEIFVHKLGDRLGPKSNSNKMLVIDGVPFHLKNAAMVDYFDYGIVQSYNSSSYTDLQARFNSAAAIGWAPEKYIFTETFEDYGATGGVNHTLREGGSCKSLEGMARFKPMYNGELAKRKGGCGTYHMEVDYLNIPPYGYTQDAIRIMSGLIK